MCGLAGSFFGPNCEHDVRRINAAQVHRGPDEVSAVVGENWALGHTRLQIVGLGAPGSQPLAARSGRWLVAFNGEIYNHEELRRAHDLPHLGPSDGAVIPELLDRYGVNAFGLLRGMYAIVAVNTEADSVLVAVDPLGIKPLHWARRNRQVLVASEPKALGAADIPMSPAPEAIDEFLFRGSISADRSGLQGVHRLAPGEWRQFGSDGRQASGQTPFLEPGHKRDDWQAAAGLFQDAVSSHMLSDVPIALLLSDGVDSTALAQAMARHGSDFVSLTVDLGSGRDETAGARATAEMLGVPLIEVREELQPPDVSRFFDAMQRPSCDGLNTYLVSKAVAAQGLKVAVSGLGGDEILCGYPYHQRFRWSRWLSALPHRAAAAVLSASTSGLTPAEARRRLGAESRGRLPATPAGTVSLARQLRPIDGWAKSATEPRRIVSGGVGLGIDEGIANEFSLAEMDQYLTSVLLPDADAFSMAHSVEMRVPFLDAPFASSVFAIKDRALGKRDFTRAVRSEAVRQSFARPKQGFTLPVKEWMRRGPLREALQLARTPNSPWREVVPDFVRTELPASGGEGPLLTADTWRRTWSIVVLDQWLRSL